MPCLLAHARPALPPPSPSPLLIVSCSRDTRILFLVISFLFVSPFCGSTKRIGPFVLPQKGRTVPSLFLFYLSADFRSLVLRPPTGAISVDRASSGFGYGGGIWVYYEFRQAGPRALGPITGGLPDSQGSASPLLVDQADAAQPAPLGMVTSTQRHNHFRRLRWASRRDASTAASFLRDLPPD